MTCVGVFIGQCGVTIGYELLKTQPSCMQRLDGLSHAIFIDAELKVIRGTKSRHVDPDNIITERAGCGGCWGAGKASAQRKLEAIMETIQAEVERCDFAMGFLLVHSLAGGTGSGYGSVITSELKARYPCMLIVNVVVAPFVSGENPLQCYNMALCLHTLQDSSDGIFLADNDKLLEQLPNPSLTDINKKLISSLRCLLSDFKQVTKRHAIWECLKLLCAIPSLKIVSFGEAQGEGVVRAVKSMTNYGKLKTISAVVCNYDTKHALLDTRIQGKVEKAFSFVEWNPFPVEFWCSKSKTSSVTYAANSKEPCNKIVRLVNTVIPKVEARAFLHWYERYDVGRRDMEEALMSLDGIVRDYQYYF